MFSFVMRQPFVILGAIGLLSVLKSFLTIHEDVAAIINAYQVVTRGAWDFLFGWLYIYIPISVPGWVKDYLSMGVIIYSSTLRVYKALDLSQVKSLEFQMYNLPFNLFFWPIFLFILLLACLEDPDICKLSEFKIFIETALWAIAICCLSYSLFLADSIK